MPPRIVNFGSLNIDHVYQVPHIVSPGETLAASSYNRHAGGKGLNQSIALARAGARVFHAGKVGREGEFLRRLLEDNHVDVQLVQPVDSPSGHAIIQVAESGENSIVLFAGANSLVAERDIDAALSRFESSDWLLTQNETSGTGYLLQRAAARGMKIFFNPAPMSDAVLDLPLEVVSAFILNEIEGAQLTGKSGAADILESLRARFPNAAVVLTLGAQGVLYADSQAQLARIAEPVSPVDTTAAGDTFTGFYVAALASGRDVRGALDVASRAAALCVTRRGAAVSIPHIEELAQ